MSNLTEDQRDLIGELVNLGIGRGARSLSEMTNEEVMLSVPCVDLRTRSNAAADLETALSPQIVAIRQEFSGAFAGDAILLFPQSASVELIRVLLANNPALEAMTELEQEALSEVGNVILNACLSSFGDMLEVELSTALPVEHRGSPEEALESASCGATNDDAVLYISIDFSLQGRQIKGYVVFVLGVGSLKSFQEHVDRYLERMSVS